MVGIAALAVVLHALEIASLRLVSHDDTISYLAATGHQGEFQAIVDDGLPPVSRWVPASRWQALTRIDERLPLLTIARDLGHHDIHPPVYFWLLHVWALVVGVHLWTGPALNLVLHLLTAIVLWRLARRLLGSPWAAWAVTGIWATLPAVVETAGSARQYSLATLLGVLTAAAFLRARDVPSRRSLVVLGAWSALGMLTLYTFGLLVAGLALVCVADLVRAERRGSAALRLTAFAAAGVVFVACQPWLREVLARQRDQSGMFTVPRLLQRMRLLREGLPAFAIADVPVAAGLVLLLVTAVIAVLAWRARPRARPVVWLAVWIPVAMAAAFLATISPGPAWQARHFSFALPFVAFLPVAAWPYVRARPVAVLAAAVFLAAAAVNVTAFVRGAQVPPAATLDGPQPVVLDNLARGVLLRILWDAPPDLPVYAADQPTLLATTDRWLRCDAPLPCHARPVVLATQVQYDATAAGQAALLTAARTVRRVVPAPALGPIAAGYRTMADRYRLSAPLSVASSDGAGVASQSGARSRTARTTIATSTPARRTAATASAP